MYVTFVCNKYVCLYVMYVCYVSMYVTNVCMLCTYVCVGMLYIYVYFACVCLTCVMDFMCDIHACVLYLECMYGLCVLMLCCVMLCALCAHGVYDCYVCKVREICMNVMCCCMYGMSVT